MAARRLLILALLIGAATTAAAGVHHHKTRPCPQCGIPRADYQFRDRSPSVTAVSKTHVFLDDPNALLPPAAPTVSRTEKTTINTSRTESQGKEIASTRTEQGQIQLERLPTPPPNAAQAVKRNIKLYQWDQAKLEIDQCSISRLALQMNRNGDWELSLRADQNPRPAAGQAQPFNPTAHIKRNQFVVHMRCYGNFTSAADGTGTIAGRPILAELNPGEFWVQNGEPRNIRTAGSSQLVKDNFDRIDRVELEFFYRK
jgi:hypothetical protein